MRPSAEPGGDVGAEVVPGTARRGPIAVVIGLIVAATVVIGMIVFLGWAWDLLRSKDSNRLVVVGVAIAIGVGGVFFLYWGMNRVVDWLPARLREGVRPYVFVGPCLVILAVFLVYPVFNTILTSLKDARSANYVGLANFRFVFSDSDMLKAIRNTALWIVLVPLTAVSIGLLFATLADRLHRGEAAAKSLIFLPMAISFAGATITWALIYSYRPAGFGSNVGLLNGVMLGLGQNPVKWLELQPWNNLLLMVIMVWMQTGFAMVVLSAAIKAIPDEIIEAARIDGASEFQVFRRIMIPTILPTVVVVTTYMVVNAMKVFDIVFVQPASAEVNGTVVIAERMIRWFFLNRDAGKGAAIAVVLFIAIVPMMIWNVKRFREEEEIR